MIERRCSTCAAEHDVYKEVVCRLSKRGLPVLDTFEGCFLQGEYAYCGTGTGNLLDMTMMLIVIKSRCISFHGSLHITDKRLTGSDQ